MTKELSEAAAAMGRKGGKARNKHLTKERITEIARKAGIASGKARKQKQEEPQ
jgi:general stress protein YciG